MPRFSFALLSYWLDRLGRAALFAAACMAMANAAADTFPSQNIVIKVGYPAGGGGDVAARQLSGQLQHILGKPVVIENQGGAGGSVATMTYLRQPADGHYLVVLTGNDAVMNPIVSASAKYRPDELRLLHPLIFSDLVLVTARDDAPGNIDELIARMKAPGAAEYSFGNWGIGSTPHLAAADFRAQAGIQSLDVPYKGISPIVQDLIGKGLDYAFIPLISSVLDMIRSGRLKAVSMATAGRNPLLPDVPAAGESKVLKAFDYKVWPGIFVNAKTPQPVVETLHAAISSVVNGERYQKWSVETGNRPMTPMTLAQADAFYQDELARNQRLAAMMKLSPQ
ncbi:tripartite tricarboxylate transporter substrate binding protein [Bordetella bronchialis]|uniref:ABC transporter substrate-binding protein n=1 Tax=Bordetella bronchialis TaxID=463025 RepID=A0A193FIU2_9BORD|nr:tripartite tricarboxylate transporter substrate binding protein [Bordetella bronchialis]ANN67101.1 hypothetical protein BAU06_13105 [Bordetella bronchialis]ANN72181.1 hypothetical protein BAU08_13300 [Bordetella bronchialis]